MIEKRRHGMTLLELTVGVAVMSGVIASAYLCLHAGFTSQSALNAHLDELQKARVILALIAKDLRHACVWSKDAPFIGLDRTLGTMEADNLDFTTHHWSPQSPGEGDTCEVSYYVNQNARTGEIGVWRRRDTSPDPELTAGGQEEELITGISELRFEYYDGFLWYDEWGQVDPRRELPREPTQSGNTSSTSLLAGNLYGLPDAVRISIAFGGDEESDAEPAEPPRTAAPPETAEPPETMQSTAPVDVSGARVYQTVVHLNLAARARSASSSTTSSSSSAEQTVNTTQ